MTLTSGGNLLVGRTTDVGTNRLVVDGGSGIYIADVNSHVYTTGNSTASTANFNIRGAQTKNACVAFTETSVADRWAIGIKGGDASLIFGSGTNDIGTATERARLTSDGDLLLGLTTDTFQPSKGVAIDSTNSSRIAIGHANGTASGDYYCSFAYNAGVIGSISQSGTTAVLYNTTSDQRLKENIADADSASTLIDALQVRKFDWKADGNHQRYGFVAQELVTVAPEAVHQPEDTEEMMAVDYSKLVPMLVKEIQSLRKRLADAGI